MLQDIRNEIGAGASNRVEVQCPHLDDMQRTAAVHNLPCGIIFIRSSAYFLHLFLVRELSKLALIDWYIDKQVYTITIIT